MGWAKKQKQKGVAEIEGAVPVHVAGSAAAGRESRPARAKSPKAAAAPTPARTRQHRKSTLKSGRTIAATREHLETASQRQAAHRKARRHQRARLVTVSLIFASIVLCLVVLYFQFTKPTEPSVTTPGEAEVVYQPTIEIIDEDAVAVGSSSADLSSRMRAYIGQAEADFRDLGYTPERAVIPAGSIRQINFYLAGYPGYVKLFLDRPTAESVEDADRLLRYLKAQNITNFEYIDVRLPEKAYWK